MEGFPEATGVERLLIHAAVGEDRSAASWRAWRTNIDLEHIDSASASVLSLFGDELSPWIEGDPEKSLIVGVRKHAWSVSQHRTHELLTLLRALRKSFIEAMVIGPSASALFFSSRTFPIWHPTLLVRRSSVQDALQCLGSIGWRPCDLAFLNQLDLESSVELVNDGGSRISLCWQIFPCPNHVKDQIEWMVWDHPQTLERRGERFYVPAPELHLIEALLRSESANTLWVCEVLLLLRQGAPDWRYLRKVIGLLDRPDVVAYTLAMLRREWNAPVPWHLARAAHLESSGLYRRARALNRDYQTWLLQSGSTQGWRSLQHYLQRRWAARSRSQLPLLGLMRILRSRKWSA